MLLMAVMTNPHFEGSAACQRHTAGTILDLSPGRISLANALNEAISSLYT